MSASKRTETQQLLARKRRIQRDLAWCEKVLWRRRDALPPDVSMEAYQDADDAAHCLYQLWHDFADRWQRRVQPVLEEE